MGGLPAPPAAPSASSLQGCARLRKKRESDSPVKPKSRAKPSASGLRRSSEPAKKTKVVLAARRPKRDSTHYARESQQPRDDNQRTQQFFAKTWRQINLKKES